MSAKWSVVSLTAGGTTRTKHRSQPEAYRKVQAIRNAVLKGASRVVAIRVEQWEPGHRRWALYERIDPKEQK